VRYSSAPKVLLALTVALTLSLKVIVRDSANENEYLDVQGSLIAFLTRHQFESHGTPSGKRIDAVSGDCRLVIRQMIPQGYDLEGVKTAGAQEGRLSFVFKGLIYTDLPLRSTALSHYWTRLQQMMGLNASLNPVLAVSASGSCSINALPWKEIADLS